MTTVLNNPLLQYGALGLACFVVTAGIRAFFMLMAQRQEAQTQLFDHHSARERACAEQFVACIDRNSAALEKVEQGLQRINIQLVRSERLTGELVVAHRD